MFNIIHHYLWIRCDVYSDPYLHIQGIKKDWHHSQGQTYFQKYLAKDFIQRDQNNDFDQTLIDTHMLLIINVQ